MYSQMHEILKLQFGTDSMGYVKAFTNGRMLIKIQSFSSVASIYVYLDVEKDIPPGLCLKFLKTDPHNHK